MPIELGRAKMVRANSRIVGADDHDDIEQVLALRLDAAELCKLVAYFDADQEDESILLMILPVLVNWPRHDGATRSQQFELLSEARAKPSGSTTLEAQRIKDQSRIRSQSQRPEIHPYQSRRHQIVPKVRASEFSARSRRGLRQNRIHPV